MIWREIIGENFEKRENRWETIKKKTGENFGRDNGRKKDMGRKFRKIVIWIIPLHVAFFLAHLIKYLFYIFFSFSNVDDILSI